MDAPDGLDVTVPAFRRADITREADLIEEVARVHGVDRLPTSLPARRRAVGRLSEPQRLRRRLEDALRDRGLFEVVSYSFTSPATLARLRVEAPIALANPLSEDQSVMRPLVLPGLLDAARHNAARGREAVALFESARAYGALTSVPTGTPAGATPASERHHIAAVLTQASPATWRSDVVPADFFAAKALVEHLLDVARVDAPLETADHPFLHPARQAAVKGIGWVGELHPAVAAEWDLGRVGGFELDFDAIAERSPGPRAYKPVSAFPPVVQDIAVVTPDDVPFAAVDAAVRSASDLLVGVAVFDVYSGPQVGEGRRSLALRLRFRAPDRTLTDADVAAERERIESALTGNGWSLRA